MLTPEPTKTEPALVYAIAEMFDSIQGEGAHAGIPMRFLRLPGCNVGRFEGLTSHDGRLGYPTCTTALGQSFVCDTKYQGTGKIALEDVFRGMPQKWLSITGGEPLLHNLAPLIMRAGELGIQVQIETSGTLLLTDPTWRVFSHVYIACSPKVGWLPQNRPYIDEWRFAIDSGPLELDRLFFQIEDIVADSQAPVYLSPVNGVDNLNQDNVALVRDILLKRPTWRISLQLHKILKVR